MGLLHIYNSMQASNDQNKEYVTAIVYKYRYIYTYMLATYLFILSVI